MNSYLERLRHELEEVTGSANPGVMETIVAGKWSPAQILEHLFLTYQGTNRGLEKCLQQNALLATRATWRDRFAAILVVNLGYIPGGRKSPERAMPRGMPFADIQRLLPTELQAMGSKLDDCESKFGSATKILDHPFLGPLTAGQWRKFHLVHGRHHLRQIRDRIKRT